jgi:hypothetical protein
MRYVANHVETRSQLDGRGERADRRAIVVSFAEFAGDLPFSPRIQRTTHLVASLERQFDLQVERVPGQPGQAAHQTKESVPRALARKALAPLVPEPVEVPARLALRGWKPSGRGALLIGWPYSPLSVAASHLVAAGIPYVVDVGDPWVLTEPAPARRLRRLSLRRAKAAETFLWRHAAAGVVTTETQAAGLRALFPGLEVLVRPNGYATVDEAEVGNPPAEAGDELRLVHFGSINSARASIGRWLSTLRGAAGIRAVRFANYGPVERPELLSTGDPAVVVETHSAVDWARACQIARTFHAGVVIGNANPAQLPSKAIQYLTLPVPRIALTPSSGRGELAAFAARSPGFIAVGLDSPDEIPSLLTHLRRAWPAEELSPPAGDSWAEVAQEVARFAIESWDRARPLGPEPRAFRASSPATNPKATRIHR